MQAETVSIVSASISAICAAMTVYLYRKQGKGFIWTKDMKVNLVVAPNKDIHLSVEIPLFNFGTGNLKFINLKSKTIFLKSGKVNTFNMDMDEAYFPPGVPIISYKTPVLGEPPTENSPAIATQVRIHRITPEDQDVDPKELQETINQAATNLGDVLFILKIRYKNGSWFGLGRTTTVISMFLHGFDLNFLSTEKRKELNNLFD